MKVDGLLDAAVFGPVDSRRYGRSLGVNLLPGARKICSFDCPYCECGRTDRAASTALDAALFPPAAGVAERLSGVLRLTSEEGLEIDAITLAGNGEPTLHPEFLAVMESLARSRDRWAPRARMIALTNGSTLADGDVREGLMVCDERIVKVDAADDDMLRRMNGPVCGLRCEDLFANAESLPAFTTQTMFIRGFVDNATDEHVAAWIDVIDRLQPTSAQVYSIDRRPAEYSVRSVPVERLREIADRLARRTGVPTIVYD